MDEYLKKFQGSNYGHCIVKEELIISDDEESGAPDEETVDESIDESFFETGVSNKYNEMPEDPTKRERKRCFGNKNDKPSALDLFLKTNNLESNELFENPKEVTNVKKSKATDKATIPDNIDTLYEKFGKSLCHKCNFKRAVVRQQARCRKCKTKLTYSCEVCDKPYCTFTELGYHLKSQHTSTRVHPCPVCNKTFAFRKGMLAHKRIQHGYADESGNVVQRCTNRSKKFKTRHTRKHEKVGDKEATFACNKCPYVALYKSNLTNHMIERHTNFKKKCEKCDKVFTNPRSMKRHSKVYCNKAKRIECHHCGHKYYRKDQMIKHIDQAHFGGSLTGQPVDDSQVTRICKYCDTTLDRYVRLKYHLRRCESAPLNFRRQCPPNDDCEKNRRICKYCGSKLKQHKHMRYHLDRCESAPSHCRLESETADQPNLGTACKHLSNIPKDH